MTNVKIDGQRYAPVDEARAQAIGRLLNEFSTEATTYWRERFIENDTDERTGQRWGMYAEGDEKAPFFSEAFLYNLLGKDEARSVLSIVRELCELAGVER